MLKISRSMTAAVVSASMLCPMTLVQAQTQAQNQAPSPIKYSEQNPSLDPTVLRYILPADLVWKQKDVGLQVAVVMGDPNKEGPYIFFAKWAPHHMSRPHYHPHDRFITVISGTWWIGTGDVYQPDKTIPMKQGSFITHFGKQVHYDGAKDEECIIEIVGDGPAPSIPAEKK
jgi:hypothetical protein